jgi:hypothetical protein
MIEPADKAWEGSIDPAVPEFLMSLERRRARLGFYIRSHYKRILRVFAIIALARIVTVIVAVAAVNSSPLTDSVSRATPVGAGFCGVSFALAAGLTALLGSVDRMPWWLAVVLILIAVGLMVGEFILTTAGLTFSPVPGWGAMVWNVVALLWSMVMLSGMVFPFAFRLVRQIEAPRETRR